MALNLNLLNLSLNALIQHKNTVIQQSMKQINNLEQDYIQQINQLNLIKQALLTQYQKNLTDQIDSIDHAIKQKLPSNNHSNIKTNKITNKFTHKITHIPTPIKMQPLPLPNLDDITISTQLPSLTADNSNHSTSTSTSSQRDISPSNTSPSTDNYNNNNNNNSYSDIPDFTNLSLPNLTCIISSIDTINNMHRNTNTNSNGPKIEPNIDQNHQHLANGICNNNPSVNTHNITSYNSNIIPTSDLSTNHNMLNDTDDKDKIMRDIKDIKDIKIKRHYHIKPSVDCHLCHQSFDSQKSLRNHIDKVHTFTCDLCSKSFQKKIDLKRHQRIHDGVSVYECKICFKTYTSAATLNNHMRLHQVSSLFRCEYCSKGFTQNHHLKRHLRIHTGMTPFNCRYCDRPFKYKTSMQRHERTVHKDIYVPIIASSTTNIPPSLNIGKEDKK